MSDRSFSSNTIDRLLHLAVTSVSSLYRIGCCLQHLIIKEGKSLLKIRGMELRENLAKVLKTGELGAKLSQLFQGCICTTASVEESIDFIHQFPKCSKVRTAPGKLENLLVFSLA